MRTDGTRRKGSSVLRLAAAVMAAVLVLAAMALAGCGNRKEAETKTIRFVTWKPNQPEVWDEIIGLFEKENPGLKVAREIGPHSSTAFHDLLTQKLKNQSTDVDVFLMDVVWPPEFAAAGWALPLEGYLQPGEKGQFLEAAVLADTFGDKLYGIPLFIDAGVLYYRTDLLKAAKFSPPETWEQLADQATRIMKKEAKRGRRISGFSGQFKQYEGLVCNMMEFILGNGGAIVDPETGTAALGSAQAVQAVTFVRDRIIGKIAPQGVLTYQEPESLDLFVQGKAVFLRSWPYAWEIANNPKKSKISGKVGIAVLPHFAGGTSYSALGGWHVGISRFSQQPAEAWKFVAFLTSERVQKMLALQSGKAPTRTALYEDEEVLKANPHFADLREVFLTAYPRPRTPLYPAVSNVLQRYFSAAVSGAEPDIPASAAAASKEIDDILSMAR